MSSSSLELQLISYENCSSSPTRTALLLMSGSNSSEWCVAPRPISGGGIGAGCFLATAALLAPLPQLIRVIRRKSSAGVSLFTLTLALFYMTANVVSSLLTKWNTLQTLCGSEPGACVIHLLDVLQQVNADIAYIYLLIGVTSYPPLNSWRRRAATYSSFLLVVAVLTGFVMFSSQHPCTRETSIAAEYSASFAGLVVVVAFIPQLVETWRCQGRGSISYLFFAIQAVGCLLIAAVNALVFHDSWTTWVPFLVGGAIQASIVGLGVYFLYCPGMALQPPKVEEALWRNDAVASLLSQAEPSLHASQPIITSPR